MRNPARPVTALIAVGAGFLAFCAGNLAFDPVARACLDPEFLAEWFRVGRVMRLAHTKFVDPEKADFKKLGRAADTGAMIGLDPYSAFLDTRAYEHHIREAEQNFTGIGVQLHIEDDFPTVTRVFSGSGAETAGIRAGDRITGAEGASLKGLPIDAVIEKLRGPEGAGLRIAVLSKNAAAEKEITVKRGVVFVPTVTESILLPDGKTGCVTVDHFEKKTVGEITGAMRGLKKNGATRFILDLRDNPGGMLDSAIAVVGLFTPKGSLVTKLTGRTSEESATHLTKSDPEFPDAPLAILVNEHSASASEIVAGALQDHGRAKIFGLKTFGKGVVQTVYELDSETALKLTTARYALPGGRLIHGAGITPDVVTKDAREAAVKAFGEAEAAK